MDDKEENYSPNDSLAETRASFTQLLSQAQEILEKLSNLKLDSISGSETKLQDFVNIIIKLQEEYMQQGKDGVLKKVTDAVKKFDKIIERSGEISTVLNIDITDCIKDQKEQIERLGKNLINNFIEEATGIISKAINTVDSSKKLITDLTEEISGLPAKLSSSIITWNPGPVIKEFIDYVIELASRIPDQISKIIEDATDLINNLPSELLICVNKTVEKAEDETDLVLKIIAGNISIKFGEAVIEYLLR